MPIVERYQVDYFAILTLLACLLIIIFLVIAAVYFTSVIDLKPPGRSESTFLFWAAIIMAVIFLALAIYALVRIFTYTVPVVINEPVVAPAAAVVAPVAPVVVTPAPAVAVAPPVRITEQPFYQDNFSQDFSDVPLTRDQRQALNAQLLFEGQE